MSEKLYNALNL